MRIACLLVAMFLFAGCVETEPDPDASASSSGTGTQALPTISSTTPASSPVSTTSAAGPNTITLVTFRATYYVNRTGSGSTMADLGDHCGRANYKESPPEVTFRHWGSSANTASPSPTTVNATQQGTLIRQYVSGSNANQGVMSLGTGLTHTEYPMLGGDVSMTSAFRTGATLFRLTTPEGKVRINGTELPVGGTWDGRVETQKTQQEQDGSTTRFYFTEVLRIKNHGSAKLVHEHIGNPCI